jgi:hypothetical protein
VEDGEHLQEVGALELVGKGLGSVVVPLLSAVRKTRTVCASRFSMARKLA